ncbi:MAG: hypothetical protein AB3N14_13075, partial [Flavobacteriaceae bacterium]
MRIYLMVFVFLTLSTLTGCAQNDNRDYEGEWVGFLPSKNSFNFKVGIEKLENNVYHLTIANDQMLIEENLPSSSLEQVRINVNQQLFFDLKYDQEGQALSGFIKSGKFL